VHQADRHCASWYVTKYVLKEGVDVKIGEFTW
jgi:hypothetical protein